MTREEKQLLLKDLCARLSYHVIVHYHHQYNENGKDVMYDEDRVFDYFEAETIEHTLEEPEINWPDEYWKPYLRPMSSMTEEEYKEYDAKRKHICDEYNRYCFDTVESIDWLNEHHFDFRGLIDKGLALEAPYDMYKTK